MGGGGSLVGCRWPCWAVGFGSGDVDVDVDDDDGFIVGTAGSV